MKIEKALGNQPVTEKDSFTSCHRIGRRLEALDL